MAEHQAWIALGGNIGDVRATFERACVDIEQQCRLIAKSKWYQTPAFIAKGGKAQADYWNAVIQVQTSLEAADLLAMMHDIEAKHGRKRQEHWGARTLDLDLLAYDHMVCHDDALTLPHPEMAKRLFVLQPFADVCPDWEHPISQQSLPTMIQDRIKAGEILFEGQLWTSHIQA